jgi:signal transduction histidine kinase
MSRRIKDYNDQKIEFFTFISHEFRTPIAVILTVLHKVKNVSKSISSNQVKILDQNVKRLNLLVDQILDFRQIEEEKIEINATPCDLGEFIPKLIRSFSEIEDKTFTFSIDHNGSAFVLLDEDKLEKILTNLISNAIKFTSQNGKIDIEAIVSSNELT